jgi:hypothetical protein
VARGGHGTPQSARSLPLQCDARGRAEVACALVALAPRRRRALPAHPPRSRRPRC